MKLEFHTVDVFTKLQFGGNPLAVLPDAQGLSTEQMQAIAGEFNLSETTFVLPPRDPGNTARVRIFTPRAEMPFAGHPNVGTAFVLARAGMVCGRAVPQDELRFEEEAGLVRVEPMRGGGEISGARLESPQALSTGLSGESIAGSAIAGSEGVVPSVDVIARACSLRAGDIETGRHTPCVASCGVPFTFVELTSREALARAAPRYEEFAQHNPRALSVGVHLYWRETTGPGRVHARMFAPLDGVGEDPATGSANVALAGILANLEQAGDLRLDVDITQGEDMGRPSYLAASALKQNGTVTRTWIGGGCVPVMTGAIDVR